MAQVLKEGELVKQPSNFGRWRTRWFRLTSSALAYFEKEGGAIKGGILLETVSSVRTPSLEETRKSHTFAIDTKEGRSYVLQSESDLGRDQWIRAVQSAISALGGSNESAPASTEAASVEASGGDDILHTSNASRTSKTSKSFRSRSASQFVRRNRVDNKWLVSTNAHEKRNKWKDALSQASSAINQQRVELRNIQTSDAVQDRLCMDVSTPVHGPASGPVDYSALHDPGFDKVTAHRQNAKTTLTDATAFLNEVYAERPNELKSRLAVVTKSIADTGTYTHTHEEIEHGARLAWRNSARCVGRATWKSLQLFDRRDITDPDEMFDCLVDHIQSAWVGGHLQPTITVFRQSPSIGRGFHIWNSQFFMYAGFELEDGTIVGDPKNKDFTDSLRELGWTSEIGPYQLLPIAFESPEGDVFWYELPEDLHYEVPITHPSYDFESLNVKWYAMPAVSNMAFDCGGVWYSAAPFNGWYMATEIVRDLLEPNRYNLTDQVADVLGVDKQNDALWKERVFIETTAAVLHSYTKHQVALFDPKNSSESFLSFFHSEMKTRGGCPADWVWLQPPLCPSMHGIWHQEMLNYKLKPSFEYQAPRWNKRRKPRMFSSFKAAVRLLLPAIYMAGLLRKKRRCVRIIYATATGRSRQFAEMAAEILKTRFVVEVFNVVQHSTFVKIPEKPELTVFIAATTGDGEAPPEAIPFTSWLESDVDAKTWYKDHAYALFAHGSSAYTKFCEYGFKLDELLKTAGAKPVIDRGVGDALSNLNEQFTTWLVSLVTAASSQFHVAAFDLSVLSNPLAHAELKSCLDGDLESTNWSSFLDLGTSSQVQTFTLTEKEVLYEDDKDLRCTIRCAFEAADMPYLPGDHFGIFPENQPDDVSYIISRTACDYDPDVPVHVVDERTKKARRTPPPMSFRALLSKYLDINLAPTSTLISHLLPFAQQESDTKMMESWLNDGDLFADVLRKRCLNFRSLLELLPSLKPSALAVTLLLPQLRPRLYSISSHADFKAESKRVELTVSVVEYKNSFGEKRQGLCTGFLKAAPPKKEILAFIKCADDFRLPQDDVPLILIGSGSGLAPMRGFWQHRQLQCAKNIKLKPAILYFGCRSKSVDYIYEAEMNEALAVGALSKLRVAFSRDPPKKVYTTHLLAEDSAELLALLDAGGHVYVCGELRMGHDVIQCFNEFSSESNLVDQLRSQGRWHEDFFGAKKVV